MRVMMKNGVKNINLENFLHETLWIFLDVIKKNDILNVSKRRIGEQILGAYLGGLSHNHVQCRKSMDLSWLGEDFGESVTILRGGSKKGKYALT